MSFCKFCLGLAVPWLIFKRVIQMNSVSVSLIKYMIMPQHLQLIKIRFISTQLKAKTNCYLSGKYHLSLLLLPEQEQFTGIGNKIHVLQNECAPVQTVIDIESHQL